MLKDILNKIDDSLSKNFKEVFNTLNSGAEESELIKLNEICHSNNGIPEELITIYKWHNGQSYEYSINQDDNRSLLPINEVIEAWRFLNDPMEEIQEPLSKFWIPILYNGTGDYVVLETEGKNRGNLISYWHDDEDRDIEHENLESWAQEVLKYAQA